MALQIELLEGRLKSFVSQLQVERGILDRIVYKNKNQHRRCSYFQYLLKVHRNLKLLNSIHLEELLDSCFIVLTGRKAKAKANLLETLKRSKSDGRNFNFMERLHGAARLLSEMVEPILKTATQISVLLARTFFMGFSVMILAILARVRVLVQQMLLDVVSVFNEISSLAQKKQSIKITQDGLEIFREYYPMMEEVVTLECIWKTDKFELAERSDKVERRHESESLEGGQIIKPPTKYQSIGAFLEEPMTTDANQIERAGVLSVKRKRPDSPIDISNQTNVSEQAQIAAVLADDLGNLMPPQNNIVNGSSIASSSPPSTSCTPKPISVSYKKVAFISVAKPVPAALNVTANQVNDSRSQMSDNKEHPPFNLFSEDDSKDSIF